jgi:hypothetical protein
LRASSQARLFQWSREYLPEVRVRIWHSLDAQGSNKHQYSPGRPLLQDPRWQRRKMDLQGGAQTTIPHKRRATSESNYSSRFIPPSPENYGVKESADPIVCGGQKTTVSGTPSAALIQYDTEPPAKGILTSSTMLRSMSTAHENDAKASEPQPIRSNDEELSHCVLVLIHGALARRVDNTL